MENFFAETEIRDGEAQAIARGLYAVARADKQVHEQEAALIADFFAASGASSPASVAELLAPIHGTALAACLGTPELRRLFVKTALLLAYADSVMAASEKTLIDEYAAALGVGPSEVALMETQVKEFLLSQLSHLANVDGAAAVARKLGV